MSQISSFVYHWLIWTCIADSQARWAFSVWILIGRGQSLKANSNTRQRKKENNKNKQTNNQTNHQTNRPREQHLCNETKKFKQTMKCTFSTNMVQREQESKMYLFNKSGTAWAGKSGGTKMECRGGAWKIEIFGRKFRPIRIFQSAVILTIGSTCKHSPAIDMIVSQTNSWSQPNGVLSTHRPTANVCHRRAKVLLVHLNRFEIIFSQPILLW